VFISHLTEERISRDHAERFRINPIAREKMMEDKIEIRLTSPNIDRLCRDFDGFQFSKDQDVDWRPLTVPGEGGAAEPIITAILVAFALAFVKRTGEKFADEFWDSISSWVKKTKQPLTVERNGRNMTITVQIAEQKEPPAEYLAVIT
jgi:hypothetical protein